MRSGSATTCSSASAPGVPPDDTRAGVSLRAPARRASGTCRTERSMPSAASSFRCRDLDRAAQVLRESPGIRGGSRAAPASGVIMRLGAETIELVPAGGRQIPADSRSNDRWFQHLAIVVSDIDRAYAQRAAGRCDADLGRAADPARLEPECRRHPRGLFPRSGRPSARTDPVPARQGRAALAGEGPAVPRHRPHRDRRRATPSAASPSIAIVSACTSPATSENWGIEQERLSGVAGRACADHDACAPQAGRGSSSCNI